MLCRTTVSSTTCVNLQHWYLGRALYKQGVALKERKRTGPPCSVGRRTGQAPGPAAADRLRGQQRYRWRQTTPTDNDRRQRAKQYWPIRWVSNSVNLGNICTGCAKTGPLRSIVHVSKSPEPIFGILQRRFAVNMNGRWLQARFERTRDGHSGRRRSSRVEDHRRSTLWTVLTQLNLTVPRQTNDQRAVLTHINTVIFHVCVVWSRYIAIV